MTAIITVHGLTDQVNCALGYKPRSRHREIVGEAMPLILAEVGRLAYRGSGPMRHESRHIAQRVTGELRSKMIVGFDPVLWLLIGVVVRAIISWFVSRWLDDTFRLQATALGIGCLRASGRQA